MRSRPEKVQRFSASTALRAPGRPAISRTRGRGQLPRPPRLHPVSSPREELPMKTRHVLTCALAASIWLAASFAAEAAETSAAKPFSRDQLEQLVAPIALYPDSLLTQVMMAATYPLEVV